jgi:hypothetical protein
MIGTGVTCGSLRSLSHYYWILCFWHCIPAVFSVRSLGDELRGFIRV